MESRTEKDLETWAAFINELIGDSTSKQLAERTGLPMVQISRWKNGFNLPSPKHAMKLARALDLDPIKVLTKAGYLNEKDFLPGSAHARTHALHTYTTKELAAELQSRLKNLAEALEPLEKQTPHYLISEKLVEQLQIATAESIPYTDHTFPENVANINTARARKLAEEYDLTLEEAQEYTQGRYAALDSSYDLDTEAESPDSP